MASSLEPGVASSTGQQEQSVVPAPGQIDPETVQREDNITTLPQVDMAMRVEKDAKINELEEKV